MLTLLSSGLFPLPLLRVCLCWLWYLIMCHLCGLCNMSHHCLRAPWEVVINCLCCVINKPQFVSHTVFYHRSVTFKVIPRIVHTVLHCCYLYCNSKNLLCLLPSLQAFLMMPMVGAASVVFLVILFFIPCWISHWRTIVFLVHPSPESIVALVSDFKSFPVCVLFDAYVGVYCTAPVRWCSWTQCPIWCNWQTTVTCSNQWTFNVLMDKISMQFRIWVTQCLPWTVYNLLWPVTLKTSAICSGVIPDTIVLARCRTSHCGLYLSKHGTNHKNVIPKTKVTS